MNLPLATPAEVDAVLAFWFGDLDQWGFAATAVRERWFRVDSGFDAEIARRFGHLLPVLQGIAVDELLPTAEALSPRRTLALIIAADQFSRNVFRGGARAFATDPLALALARAGINEGVDRALGFDARSFFYLPFEHAETMVEQHAAVALLSELRDDTPTGFRHLTGAALRFAHQHRDVIRRFGRFPHRNDVLHRISTAEERAFVATGDGFGQRVVDDARD